MKQVMTAALTILPMTAFAIGSDYDSDPVDEACVGGKVQSATSGACVPPNFAGQTDLFLLNAAQDYAYGGNYADGQNVLKAVADQADTRTLALWGYTNRKMGNTEAALTFYDKALKADPNNIRARSYLGEAYLELGDFDAARTQLAEIRARGGKGSQSETMLLKAFDAQGVSVDG